MKHGAGHGIAVSGRDAALFEGSASLAYHAVDAVDDGKCRGVFQLELAGALAGIVQPRGAAHRPDAKMQEALGFNGVPCRGKATGSTSSALPRWR